MLCLKINLMIHRQKMAEKEVRKICSRVSSTKIINQPKMV